jgi:hypothetical protein
MPFLDCGFVYKHNTDPASLQVRASANWRATAHHARLRQFMPLCVQQGSGVAEAALRAEGEETIPSISIDSWARLNDTLPLLACGHTKRPRSSRLAAPAATEDKDMTGQRLLLEHRLHLSTEPMKAAAHVGHARCDPDPGSCRECNHERKLSSTAPTIAASTLPSRLTRI